VCTALATALAITAGMAAPASAEPSPPTPSAGIPAARPATPAAAAMGASKPATQVKPAVASAGAATASGGATGTVTGEGASAAPVATGASSGGAAAGGAGTKPAMELEQMKVLEGSWRCDGRAPATPSGPEHAYRSTWKFKRDLDNFWWAAEYQQVKAKANPAPLKARGFLTYDSVAKSFTMMGVDNAGGTTHEISSGWNGDVVTLAGDANLGGKKVPFREVITKKGDREFTWRGEMKVGGDWMTLGEDRCRK
jgi:hypothetical protein